MELSNWRLVLNEYKLKQLKIRIAHAGELRGFVYRALVQTLVLIQRKKDMDMAFCAAVWVGSQVAYFKKALPNLFR